MMITIMIIIYLDHVLLFSYIIYLKTTEKQIMLRFDLNNYDDYYYDHYIFRSYITFQLYN